MININDLNLDRFIYLKYFQLRKLEEVLKKNIEVLEIIISTENDIQNIFVGIEENGTYNSYTISGFNFSEFAKIKLDEKENSNIYYPYQAYIEDTIVYRSETLLEQIDKDKKYLDEIILEYTKYMKNRFRYSNEQRKNLYDKWYSLNNIQRVRIYEELNKTCKVQLTYHLNAIVSYHKRDYIPFNYPVIFNGKEYGYVLSFETCCGVMGDRSFLILTPIRNNHDENLVDIDLLTEWRRPIITLLREIEDKFPTVSGFATYDDDFRNYQINDDYKSLRTWIDDEENPYEIYKFTKETLKNILTY